MSPETLSIEGNAAIVYGSCRENGIGATIVWAFDLQNCGCWECRLASFAS
jgi:hypothetical protein